MKTLTVREPGRQLARMLNTCDREGGIVIRRKNGKRYRIQPDATQPASKTPAKNNNGFPNIIARQKRIFGDMVLSDEQTEQIFKMLRGE